MTTLEEMLSAKNDLGDHWGPLRVYCIASVPRSGSTLLCRYLRDTEVAGDPHEYLDSTQVTILGRRLGLRPGQWAQYGLLRLLRRPAERWWTANDYLHYLHDVARVRSTPNGVFGLKAHYRQLDRALFGRNTCLERVFGPVRYVRIRRRDLEAAAVSWFRALGTGQFTSEFAALRPPPAYDYAGIAALRVKLDEEEARWDRFFERTGAPVHPVEFEELTTRPEQVVPGILSFLELTSDRPVRAPRLERQSGDDSEDMMRRFRSEWSARRP